MNHTGYKLGLGYLVIVNQSEHFLPLNTAQSNGINTGTAHQRCHIAAHRHVKSEVEHLQTAVLVRQFDTQRKERIFKGSNVTYRDGHAFRPARTA